jgi:hypothetical protein
MEDTQVLDANSKAGPLQAPEAIDDNAFLNSIQPQNSAPTKNIYGGTPGLVGEKDHASEIANNINRNNYDYKSAVDASKEPTVTTQSTTKHNVTPETTWSDTMTMDDRFKTSDNADYSWNKLAQERGQSIYNQEATQVLSDYAKSMQAINEAANQAMDQFFSAMYGSNQTADKMGWDGGGQATSEERKTAFLKAATAANMYSKDEMQRYGVDSQLSVARMYAEADMKAYALELYQNELDKAVREAELTGFYIAPEASEIMKQEDVAQNILKNPNATKAEKDRANKVKNAAYAYYDKLGFEKEWTNPSTGEVEEYPGVKILSMYELEETKRANLRNEELQRQANEIADQARKDANANAYELRLLQQEQLNRIETMDIENQNRYNSQKNEEWSKLGYFKNGYQPKWIDNNGPVSESGKKITVTTKTGDTKSQNLWKTPNQKYWVWDGSTKQYIEVDKDTKTYTQAG